MQQRLLYLVAFVGLILCANAQEDGYLIKQLSDGSNINIFYRCYGNKTIATHQMWMLQGGPGSMSTALDSDLKILSIWDRYGYYCTTDYRGVGRSDELRCSFDDACQITDFCYQNFTAHHNMSDYLTTKAAEDVIDLVNYMKTQLPNSVQVTLYGVSYGTFWLQRIMQLNNNIADKWIFDGVVLQPWFENGPWQNGNIDAGIRIMNFLFECSNNTVCKEHFNIKSFIKFYKTLDFDQKIQFDNDIQDIFIHPSRYDNGFVEAINYINDMMMFDIYSSSRDHHYCDSNPFVYKIVKANDLYSKIGYENNYVNYMSLFAQLTFGSSGISDIIRTYQWINLDIDAFDYSPIYTDGQVMVLGGEYDVQTDVYNSVRLHEYFLDNGVDSQLYIGKNWGHGVVSFEDETGFLCGLSGIYDFVQGVDIKYDCLNSSEFPTFDTAEYGYYYEPPEPKDINTVAIILGVLFGVSFLINIAILGYMVYVKKFKIIPSKQNDIPLM